MLLTSGTWTGDKMNQVTLEYKNNGFFIRRLSSSRTICFHFFSRNYHSGTHRLTKPVDLADQESKASPVTQAISP